MAVLQRLTIIEVLAAITGNIVFVDTATRQNERQQSVNRTSTERQQSVNTASIERQHSIITASTECQQSVNNFGRCILNIPSTLLWHIPRIYILAAVMSKRDRNMVTAPVWKWASTQRQRFCVLHLVQFNGCATAFNHNRSIGSLYRQYRVCRYCDTTKWSSTQCQQSVNRASTERQQSVNTASSQRQQSVNRVSTILSVASWIFQALCYGIYPESTYWQPLSAKEIATWSQPQSENERQQSVNNFVCFILYNPRAVLQHLPIIKVLAAFIGDIVCVDTATAQTEHHQSVNRASI